MKQDSQKHGRRYAKRCKTCKRKPRARGRAECNPCRNTRRRSADPVRTAWENLKSNAKKRGKIFTITLGYFRRFCRRSDYMAGKGRTAESYTVDRIREDLGYVPGNLQVLKNAENVRKYRYLVYDWQTGVGIVHSNLSGQNNGQNPF